MAIDLKKIENIFPDNYKWIVGRVSSQIGGRESNQDSWGNAETPFGFLMVVCDGMGGGPAGELASTIAVETIIKSVMDANPEEARINIVKKAIRQANEAIIQQGVENPMLQGMGSTCTVILINEKSAIAAYVGDSRIYQLSGRRKKWRTFDHSMVFGLVKQGVITEEQARLSAQSNVITRALGIKLDVEVDAIELPFEKNDRFLLTTDGIHGSMPEKKLIEILSNNKERLDPMVDKFVQDVERLGIERGGHHDNHTIAVLDVKKNSTLKTKMSKRIKCILWTLCILLCASLVLNVYQWKKENTVQVCDKEDKEQQDQSKELRSDNSTSGTGMVDKGASNASAIVPMAADGSTLNTLVDSLKKPLNENSKEAKDLHNDLTNP